MYIGQIVTILYYMIAAGGSSQDGALLTESSDFILTEAGDFILIE